MNEQDVRDLRLLFIRLLWPSCMAKERAAYGIGELLREQSTREETLDQFCRFLGDVKFESLAASSMMGAVRVKANLSEEEINRVVGSIERPSLLSELVAQELRDKTEEDLTSQIGEKWHSGAPPTPFSADPFFDRHRRGFTPPIHDSDAQKIERDCLVAFRRQWAYEWERIQDRGLPVATVPSHFASPRERVLSDCLQGEAYRSAFLRAVARFADEGVLEPSRARRVVARLCPVDLAMWAMRNRSRPDWWPRIERGANAAVSTAAGNLVTAANQLIASQETLFPGMVLAHASGRASAPSEETMELSIEAGFRRRESADPPDLDEVIGGLWGGPAIPKHVSLSWWRHGFWSKPLQNEIFSSGGWSIAPSSLVVDVFAVPRWQPYWMGRPIRCPAQYVTGPVEARPGPNGIEYRVGEAPRAHWRAWTADLREREPLEFMPGSGEFLVIDRSDVEDFCRKTGSTLFWVARAVTWTRKASYHDYQEATHTWECEG